MFVIILSEGWYEASTLFLTIMENVAGLTLKTVLCNEARTYLRDLSRQRKRETEFSALS